jgi:hypothetical protein
MRLRLCPKRSRKKAGCILLIFKAQYSLNRDLDVVGFVFRKDFVSFLNVVKYAAMPLSKCREIISFTRCRNGLPFCNVISRSVTSTGVSFNAQYW